MNRQFFIKIIGIGIAIVSLSACVYRMDIDQGNRIDAEVIDQLEIGMSRTQVEFLLGAPAIVDLYHPERWDYVYFAKSGKTGKVEQHIMTLNFSDDLLSDISGQLSPQ